MIGNWGIIRDKSRYESTFFYKKKWLPADAGNHLHYRWIVTK